MRIAVTGHKGRLGSELVSRGIQPLDCDVTSKSSIKAALHDVEPDVVIHCAAFTDVDACEEFKTEAVEINAKGTENLKICFEGKIIYLSTDYVFDGKKGMYKEEDMPSNPKNLCWYGYTKLLGEQILGNNDTIIRTTMLYGSSVKDDFVTHVLQKLELGEPFEVTQALYGTPTYVPHLAEAIMELVERPHIHIINLVGSDCWSRYDLALTIASVFEKDKMLIKPTMSIGKTKRPRHAGLCTTKAVRMELPIRSTLAGLVDYYAYNKVYRQLKMEI
jgi:dTDP-4-dehydrorhamnose reductase